MRVRRIADDRLLELAADVFRSHGYEGTSLRLLAEATGLERASLYHRFPGGKEEIARAVVRLACEWFEKDVFQALRKPGKPAERVEAVAWSLRHFYQRGTMWCVLDSMTLGDAPEEIRGEIRRTYEAWIDAFEDISREAGMDDARGRAIEALIGIEGSLVLARVSGDVWAFLRILERLPVLLTGNSEV